jgi:acid stress chaperone HdeA
MLRMYWPKENTPSILNGTWKLPPVMRVGAPKVSASATQRNKKPVAEWTCAEFLAVEDQFKPEMVAYSNSGKPEAAAISVTGTETVTPMIVSECIKTQQASFLDKVKAASSKQSRCEGRTEKEL